MWASGAIFKKCARKRIWRWQIPVIQAFINQDLRTPRASVVLGRQQISAAAAPSEQTVDRTDPLACDFGNIWADGFNHHLFAISVSNRAGMVWR